MKYRAQTVGGESQERKHTNQIGREPEDQEKVCEVLKEMQIEWGMGFPGWKEG